MDNSVSSVGFELPAPQEAVEHAVRLATDYHLSLEQAQNRYQYWQDTATGDAIARAQYLRKIFSLPQEEFERLEEELGLRKSEATMAAPETAEEPAPRLDEGREPETASEEPEHAEEEHVPSAPVAPTQEPEPVVEPPPAPQREKKRPAQRDPERVALFARFFPPGWNEGRLTELEEVHPGVYRKLTSAEHWDEQRQETKDTLALSFTEFLKQYPNRAARIEDSSYSLSLELTEDARVAQERGEPIFIKGITTSSSRPDVLRVTLGSVDLFKGFPRVALSELVIKHAVWALRGVRSLI